MRRLLAVVGLWLLGCGSPEPESRLHGPAEIVLLHTADTHSELFPWRTLIGSADARRGLGAAGEVREVGGFARLATLLRAERRRSERVLHLDAGDLFQGSLTFERFGGEPEVLAFDALGVDAQTLGNHELDRGAELVRASYQHFARFPLLGANYLDDAGGGFAELLQPFVVLTAGGLRVGVIGVANTASVALLNARPNELGVLAEGAAGAVQGALDLLRPLVDLVVVVTHLGLDADEALVRATSGIDIVLGGHQHLTLDAPKWVSDCAGAAGPEVRDVWGQLRRCAPRRVPIVHSGAYGKFIGKIRLELDDDPARLGTTYDPVDGHEVVSLTFELLPVRDDTPEDPALLSLLAPYRMEASDPAALGEVVGYAPDLIERNGATGGDSPLGNVAADAVRAAAEADLAVIGASSLRHDLVPGALDLAGLVRVVPFTDAVVRAELGGDALASAFEHAARSASERECRTQVHVSGALVRFRCPCVEPSCAQVFTPRTAVSCASDADCSQVSGACSSRDGESGVCFAPLAADAAYRVATTEYLARGGSGLFDPIAETSLVRVNDSLAAVLVELLRTGSACTPGAADCRSGCPAELVRFALDACSGRGLGAGCSEPETLCARAVASCRYVPCVDASMGAARDGRIRLEAP